MPIFVFTRNSPSGEPLVFSDRTVLASFLAGVSARSIIDIIEGERLPVRRVHRVELKPDDSSRRDLRDDREAM